MTEDHGAYDHGLWFEADGVEHISTILQRLALQQHWSHPLPLTPANGLTPPGGHCHQQRHG